MEMSLKDFHENLRDSVLTVMRRQWSALGVYMSVRPCEVSVVDPEALVVATMYFGRFDQRLFDEALDWLSMNSDLINIARLNRITKEYAIDTQRAMMATASYLLSRKDQGKRKYDRFNKIIRPSIRCEEKQVFWWHKRGYHAGGEPEPSFNDWGFIRHEPELRGMSRRPDTMNRANTVIKLRMLFGISARADVVTYMLWGKPGNSTQIAKTVRFAQRGVYSILNELAESGFAVKAKSGQQDMYQIDQDRWCSFLGMRLMPRLRYVVWADVFRACQEVIEDWRGDPGVYDNEYLASSRFRELTVEIAPLIWKSFEGIGVPDIRRPGEEYNKVFTDYMNRTTRRMMEWSASAEEKMELHSE